jgi:hypothetical protein
MRRCRYWRCRKSFFPEKHFYFYCSWDCRVADVGADYGRDNRGYQRSSDERYDRGWNDAWRSKPPPTETMPPHIWRALAVLVHPDRWQQEPGLLALSHEAMVWLNTHRPSDPERN